MKRIFLFLTFIVCGFLGSTQSFSGKTNEIAIDFSKGGSDDIIVLPFITWRYPNLEYTNSLEHKVDIDATLISQEPLKKYSIDVSDGQSPISHKDRDLSGERKSITIKESITLLDGQNVIEISAVTQGGGVVKSRRTILVGKDALATAVALDRKDYALLFATDQYDNWNDLVNPIDDARSVAKVLKERFGFQVEIVENPNTEDVFGKLRDYAERKFKPQDQLLIFFAGHGYFDDAFGEGFVVAKNSLENDKAKTTYISHSRLRQIINNIPCEHILLTMDVCFGGTFDPVIASRGGSAYQESTDSEYLVKKLGTKTRKYITSGGKEYVSDGVPGQHSPFSLKLLQAFSEGGGADHILTLAEIKTYIERIKPDPRFGGFGDDRQESDFVFVRKK